MDAEGEPETGAEPGRLVGFTGPNISDVEQRIRWPDGRVTTLSVSSTAMAARGRSVGGSIVAFEVVAQAR